jgi:hypothetical protein
MMTGENNIADNSITQIIQVLKSCSVTCDKSATALKEFNGKLFASLIKINLSCAETCRRAIHLLESGSSTGRSFLEVCEEICRMCEEENSRCTIDICTLAEKACHDCWAFLQQINDTDNLSF